MPLILVTGAAGRTSGYVIRALLASPVVKPEDLRLLVRREDAVKKLQEKHPQLPATSFVIADYLEHSTLRPALRGIDVIFHNAPAMHQLETAMGISLIDAAKEAGVKHFVYCSVLLPLLSKLLNHIVKLKVEEYLVESGLNYTILQPTSYMQNMNVQHAAEKCALMCGYSPTTLQGFVDLVDVAEVARLVLLDPAPHNRARYDLVGENASIQDVAAAIERVAGISGVTPTVVPREQVVKQRVIHSTAQGEYAQDALDRMLYYYDKRGIPGNSNTARWLLGRDATSWEGFIRRELHK